MLDRLAPLTHGLRVFVETPLDGFETVTQIEEAFASMTANLQATDAQVAKRLAAKVAREAAATEVARLHAEILANTKSH